MLPRILRCRDSMILADKKFVIAGSRERIWGLLLKSVLRSMSFERMKPLSESSVSALLQVKLGFLSLPMQVRVEVQEASAPEHMVAVIDSKGMGGIIWVKQKATFTLRPANDGNTEVSCNIADDGMGFVVRALLLWRLKSVARATFNGIEELLTQWV